MNTTKPNNVHKNKGRTRKVTQLADYKLYYEDLGFKRNTISKPNKRSAMAKSNTNRFRTTVRPIVQWLEDLYQRAYVVVNKALNRGKTAKKTTKKERENAILQRNNAILGVGLLLVVVSIAYSTAVILIGVDSLESKIALLPQVVFALVTLIKAFSKLYK